MTLHDAGRTLTVRDVEAEIVAIPTPKDLRGMTTTWCHPSTPIATATATAFVAAAPAVAPAAPATFKPQFRRPIMTIDKMNRRLYRSGDDVPLPKRGRVERDSVSLYAGGVGTTAHKTGIASAGPDPPLLTGHKRARDGAAISSRSRSRLAAAR